MWKMMGKTAGILAAGILLGALLLTGVYLLPLQENGENVTASLERLETEGWYPAVPLFQAFTGEIRGHDYGGILDNYTDEIMITTAAREARGNPLYQAMNMAGAGLETGYAYYWHGYVAVLRPLLLVFDYGEIRVLNGYLQLFLVIWLCCLLCRKRGMVWAVFALTEYGFLMPMALGCSLQYSWVFYISMAGSLLLVGGDRFWKAGDRSGLLFLGLGMFTSYFDLLTYPLVTWGMPMIWYHVTDSESAAGKRLRDTVRCGLFWILGYGGMWAGKWVLGQLILGKPVIRTAWNEVCYRAGMLEGTEGSGLSRLFPVRRNWESFGNLQNTAILLAWFLWLAWMLWKRRGRVDCRKAPALALTACSSAVWCAVLHNHTYVHVNFTYRIFAVFFGALLAMGICSLEAEERGKDFGRAGRFLPLAMVLLAGGFSLTGQEPFLIHNGYCEAAQVRLPEGEALEQTFVPRYSRVAYVYLGISARNPEGEPEGSFLAELVREGETVFSTRLSAAQVADSGFYAVPVDQKLSAGREYVLRITAEDVRETECFVSLTKAGQAPVDEWGQARLGNAAVEGQLIGGVGYIRLPGCRALLRTFLTLMGIFWGAYLCCGCVFGRKQADASENCNMKEAML